MKRNVTKQSLAKQAEMIIKMAKESGVKGNYFFVTTFERYQVQLDILSKLSKSIQDDGILVEKEDVKGRRNLCSNPAVLDYNRTTDSANKTVSTLMKIIKSFGVDEQSETADPLMDIINGEADDE